jgi:hypothetical protein
MKQVDDALKIALLPKKDWKWGGGEIRHLFFTSLSRKKGKTFIMLLW